MSAMQYKINAMFHASLDAGTAYDTACAMVDNEIVPDLKHPLDYGTCLLCGATMYYTMDYTHADDCPISIVERQHDRFQDALTILDDALAKKLAEAGRSAELRTNPLGEIGRAAFSAATAKD